MKNVHKLTEGAVLLAVYAVLILVTVFVPGLGIVTSLFLAVPFILFGAKNTRMNSFVFFIGACLISIIVGAVLAIPLTLSYGLTGLVIGYFIQEKQSRLSSFIAATLVFLATIIMQYVAAIAFFQINFIKEIMASTEEMFNRSITMVEELGQNIDVTPLKQMLESFQLMETLTPSLFVTTALMIVLLIEVISFPIVKRFGITIASWQPFRELSLPKSILWYYLFTIFATFIFKPAEGSYWFMALVNIGFLIQLFMVVQGLSFIFYLCYKKGISKAVPILATILIFIWPLFLSIVRILGIIDLGFELKKRLENH
ncbi:YybS family protein [Bacillus sp. Bva_UNVM-123]|uniref:YybS family protein n=1 Tax=Bacillus sp. Bva_UNVM-123 TaxID=2829798 RepID=UPI00391F1A99